MKIVLTGYMGSGKSVVGKALAARLGLPFLDLDDQIEKELGMDIPEIFKEKGEIFFRKKEHEFLREILRSKEAFVLSTGGGTPCYSGNMDLLLATTAQIFYLQLSVFSLTNRLLAEKHHRPLISHLQHADLQEFIGKHLFERRPFYSRAHHTIHCDGRSVDEVVLEITKKLI
ncbi:shikimate kinase [Muriicola jejuensis]|uniref:Shikimate kinase n=1 Tax=Muriicola jejuensis TaxID=504488 RepID=A0A6P0UAZ5_9FLAO|nr:shikimate kinase [Muriicola jejuensis]NER09079.1 shikimate kinase [Muriicola jejuensis]SMP11419.1 shikimate kinase [Muriicola jejuensis]